jgi:hypothetical protein
MTRTMLPAACTSIVLSALAAASAGGAPGHDEPLLKKQYDAFVQSLDRQRIARDYPGAVRRLDSPDAETRVAGLRTLGAIEEVEVIPWIVPFVDSPDQRVRVQAGLALEKTVTSHELKRRDMTRPDRLRIRPPAPGDGDLRPVAWAILRMLRTADANSHSYAATMIGYLKLGQFEDELRQMLRSRHPAETRAARTALEMLDLDPRPRSDVMSGKLDEGLAYHWSFDDEVAVDCRHGVKGQIVGSVHFEDGILGKAPRIRDGSTNIVVQSPQFNMDGWQKLTLSMWGKMDHYTTYGRAISRAEGNQSCGLALHVGGDAGYWTGGGFYVFLNNGGYLCVRPETLGKNVKSYPKTGVWYHLVGTYDGHRARFYVNGKLEGERPAEEPGLRVRDLPRAKLVIGRAAPSPKYDHWRDTYFPGLIDEVKIWHRALTLDEVALLYQQTRRRSPVTTDADP